jgi:microcystin-dependent protein
VYTSVVATNPNSLLGLGTWVAFGSGRVLVGINASDSDFNTVEETGGAKTDAHALSLAEIPSHVHGYTGVQGNGNPDGSSDSVAAGQPTSYPRQTELDYEGGGAAHSHDIVQPYIVVYFWKRTA